MEPVISGQCTVSVYNDFEIVNDASPECWQSWRDLIEQWNAYDSTVIEFTPKVPSTRITLARKKSDGSYIGSVVWNEFPDGLAYITAFQVTREFRGTGIGRRIWDHTLKRMPLDYIIELHTVPELCEWYKKNGTSYEGTAMLKWSFTCEQISDICAKFPADPTLYITLVSQLKDDEFEKLLAFDREVTGRDRSEFLRLFYKFRLTEGAVAFDTEGKVVACAGITQTSYPDRRHFKLGPVYASDETQFAAVAAPMISLAASHDAALIILYTVEGTAADRLSAHFESGSNSFHRNTRLSSRPRAPLIDVHRCFIAHNNPCHYDL